MLYSNDNVCSTLEKKRLHEMNEYLQCRMYNIHACMYAIDDCKRISQFKYYILGLFFYYAPRRFFLTDDTKQNVR